jgi:hypothetical protein
MSTQDGLPLTVDQYLELFEQGAKHLLAMAASCETCWNPAEHDPRKLHNLYARNLVTCYVSKFADLSSSLIDAVEKEHFLTYALCGRSLIEHVATLRYYVLHKYKPLFDSGAPDVEALIEIDDRFLRGGRFDWQSFCTKDYTKLWSDAGERVRLKRSGSSQKTKVETDNTEGMPSAINVTTCIDKWAAVSPGVQVVYDLFCDMVHPNVGSAFLVASVGPGGLYFAKNKGDSIGRQIFEQSFPMLVSITHKEFGDSIMLLMGTIWQDDELE